MILRRNGFWMPFFSVLAVCTGLAVWPAAGAADGGEATPAVMPAPAPVAVVAEPAAAWNTLPETTWLVLSLPDVKHARKAFESGKLRGLGNLPGLKEFVADIQKFYVGSMQQAVQGGNLQPFLKVLKLDLESLFLAPDGELTFAIVDLVPDEQRFDLVLKVGVQKDEQVATFNDLVDMVLAMRPELPLKKTELKFGAKNAFALELPEMNLAAFYATGDKALVMGCHEDRFAALVQQQPLALDKELPLKDTALVKALEKSLQGRPDLFFMVNPEAIPEKNIDDPGQVQFFQALKRLGVRKFAYALRFDDASGTVVEALAFDYYPEIWKAAGNLTQPVDLSIFERGPGGTFAQAAIHVDLPKTWAVINNFMRTGPNAEEAAQTIDGLEKFLGMKVPEFLAAFDGPICGNMALPRTATGFTANLIPDAHLECGLKNAPQLEAVMGKLNAWFSGNAAAGAADDRNHFTAEKLEVPNARAAWKYIPPGRKEPVKPVLALYENKLIFAAMEPTLQRATRATAYGPQLAEREDWLRLKGSIEKNAFCVAYLDLATAGEFGFNLAASLTEMMPNNPFGKYHLPQGDAVGKQLSGWLIQASADNNVLVIQSQSPTGVVPAIACTALIANYLNINDQQERQTVRRDMAEKRLAALYQAVVKFNAATQKLPAKLSELYPDYLQNIADFTAADQNWSMNPAGNGDRLRALIDDRTEFVMVPAHFGQAEKAFLIPKQFALSAAQGVPVVDGTGAKRIYAEAEFAKLVKEVPGAAGAGGQPGGRWRGRGHGGAGGAGGRPGGGAGGDGGHGDPGVGKPPVEPPPLPPPQDNPDQGF